MDFWQRFACWTGIASLSLLIILLYRGIFILFLFRLSQTSYFLISISTSFLPCVIGADHCIRQPGKQCLVSQPWRGISSADLWALLQEPDYNVGLGGTSFPDILIDLFCSTPHPTPQTKRKPVWGFLCQGEGRTSKNIVPPPISNVNIKYPIL